jgi:hypothetical protein
VAGLSQGVGNVVAVLVVLEDFVAPLAAIHEVLNRARILHSQLESESNGRCVDSYDRPLCGAGAEGELDDPRALASQDCLSAGGTG